MSLWIELLKAEALKLKRNVALLLVLAAPLLTSLLYFLVLIRLKKPGALADPWGSYSQFVLALWAFLALPMLVTLLATLVNGLEHQNAQWKHLFAQPVRRWKVLAVKILTTVFLMGIACYLLIPSMALLGWLVHIIRPELGFQAPFPLRTLLWGVSRPFFAAWLMLAIHLWISQRWSSIALSVGSGMLGLIGAFVVVNSRTWGALYPWCLPLRAIQPGPAPLGVVALGVFGGMAVWILGCWDGARRE